MLTLARPIRGPERTPKSIFLIFCIEVIWWRWWSSRSSQMTIWHYFSKNIHSDMFTNWPPRLTQSDTSKQKYAIICYICNKNWCRHARKMILYLFPTFIFFVDEFNEIKISFVMCTIDLVGQCHLTTILTISILVIRGARKMIIFCFPRLFG